MERAKTPEENDDAGDSSVCSVTKSVEELGNLSAISSLSSDHSTPTNVSAKSILEVSQCSSTASKIISDQVRPTNRNAAAKDEIYNIDPTAGGYSKHINIAAIDDIEHINAATKDEIVHINAAAKFDIEHINAAVKDDIKHINAAAKDDIEHINAAAKDDIEHINAAAKDDIEHINAAVEEHIGESTFAAPSVRTGNSTPKRRKMKNLEDYKEYWCSFCGKHFSHKGNMQQHERSHTKVRPFTCNLCGMAYTKSSHLLEHRKRHVGEQGKKHTKAYDCTICDRSFFSKNSLDIHLRSHSEKRSLSCDKCDMKFRHKSSLHRHFKVHAGIKSFSCDYCQKTFYDNSDLRKHIAVHTGFKNYECTTCKEKFRLLSELEIHLKSHITCKTSNNNRDEILDNSCQSEIPETDSCENSIKLKSLEDSANKPNKASYEGSAFDNRKTNVKCDRFKQTELMKPSGERALVQINIDKDGEIGLMKPSDERALEQVNTEKDCEIGLMKPSGERALVQVNTEKDGKIELMKPAGERALVQVNAEKDGKIELIKPPGERALVHVNAEKDVNIENFSERIVGQNEQYLTEKSFSPVEVTNETSYKNNQTDLDNINENSANDIEKVIGAEKEKYENSCNENTEKNSQEYGENEECSNNCGCRKDPDYKTKKKVATKILRNIIDGYMKESKTEDRTRTITVKQDVASDNVTVPKQSKYTEHSVKRSVLDPNASVQKQVEECSITVKEEMREVDFSTQKEKAENVEVRNLADTSDQIKVTTEELQIKANRKNDTEDDEGLSDENNQKKASESEVNGNVQFGSSFAVVFNLPTRKLVGTDSFTGNPCFIKQYRNIKPKMIDNDDIVALNFHQSDIRSTEKIQTNEAEENSNERGIRNNQKIHLGDNTFSAQSVVDVIKTSSGLKNTNQAGNIYQCYYVSKNISNKGKDISRNTLEKVYDRIAVKGINVNEHMHTDYTKENIKNAIKTKVKSCRHCGIVFDNRDKFLEHLRGHFKPKEITCEDCKQSFKRWRNYSHHKCSDFKKKYDYICAHCDRLFKTEKLLNDHMNCKKKMCRDCNMVFCTAEKLSIHKKTHMKYTCTKCCQKFASGWALSMHISKVHTSLKCDLCSKSFMYAQNLKRHVKQQHINVWFKCENCDVQFVSSHSYKQHKRKCILQGIEKKGDNNIGVCVVEKIESNKDKEKQIDTEAMSKDKSEPNDYTSNKADLENEEKNTKPMAENHEQIDLPDLDETVSAVASICTTQEADKYDVGEVLVEESDDYLKIAERDEKAAVVAPVSSANETDKLADIREDTYYFQREGTYPQQNVDRSLVGNGEMKIELKTLDNEGEKDKDSQGESLNVFRHDENVVEAIALSETDNEELDDGNLDNEETDRIQSSSSRKVESERREDVLRETSKLIVSNKLFHKRDRKNVGLKKIVGNRLTKSHFNDAWKENDNLETMAKLELKVKQKRTDSIKNMLGTMKNNMQAIARRIKTCSTAESTTLKSLEDSIQSSDGMVEQGSDIGESKCCRFTLECGDHVKTSQINSNKNEDSAEIDIIEIRSDSDEDNDDQSSNILIKNSVKRPIKKDEPEMINSSSDSESELCESDTVGYAEEIVFDEDLNKKDSGPNERDNYKVKALNETHLNITRTTSFKKICNGKLVVKGSHSSEKRNDSDTNYRRNNPRKRKSEMNSNMKSAIKLKRAEIVLSDINKKDRKVEMHAGDFNTELKTNKATDSEVAELDKKIEAVANDSSDSMSSDSASDEDSEGYEECTVEEVQEMLSAFNKH